MGPVDRKGGVGRKRGGGDVVAGDVGEHGVGKSALLDLLFAHFSRPEFTVRWRWKENDVAFWDNRVTQHYAVDDYRPQRRVMHRATILGDKPF